MKTPGNMVTYNTSTPAASKMLELQQKEPVTEQSEKDDHEEAETTPQTNNEREGAALPSNDLPAHKEDQDEEVSNTQVVEKVDTETISTKDNEELATNDKKPKAKGSISPSVKDIKSAIEAKEEELAKVRKSARIPTARRGKGTPEKINPLGLTGTPTEETMSTDLDIRQYMITSTKKLRKKESAPSKLKPKQHHTR